MENVRRSDVEVKGFDEVMDLMREDDDLIAPSADGFFESGNQMNDLNIELSESTMGLTLSDSAQSKTNGEQVLQPFESMGLEAKNRNRKCNLRKSLAWDSAFFNSPGVLDPEELSSMIGGAEIGERKVLFGIQEDDMRSSVSTLESDTLTLESLEAELFQDIRASIQKSNKSACTVSSSNMSSYKGESHLSVPSLAKDDRSHENKLVMNSSPKKLHKSAAESLKTKKQSRPEVAKDKHDDRCKGFSLSRPKLPNGSGKLSNIPPSPAKQVSTGTNHGVHEKHTSKCLISAVRGPPLAKLSASSKPPCAVPRPTMTSKVSVSASLKHTKKEHGIIRSSAESSSSVSSSIIAKPPLDSIKKTTAPKTTKPPASTSTLRASSRIPSKSNNPPPLKTKAQPVNSRLSAYVKSTASNVSCISPASSISEWSVDSSSSNSTVNQRSNSQTGCAEAAPFSMSEAVEGDSHCASDSQVQLRDSKIGTGATAVTVLSNNFTSEPKMHDTLPHPAAAKPSGLRMPSPKIGFFDGVKSMTRTPKRAARSNIGQHKVENICSSASGGSSNSKTGKIQLQTSTSSTKKQDTLPAVSVMKPAPHIPGRESPSSSRIKSGSPETEKYDPCLFSKPDKSPTPKTGGKSPEEIATLAEKSHDRCSRQNVKKFGEDVVETHASDILHAGEDRTDNFRSSLAESLSQQLDKASPKMKPHEVTSFVKKKDVNSETNVSVKGITDFNGEDLHLQKAQPIIYDTYKDSKTASNYHVELEPNSIANCHDIAPDLLNI